jgi:hypothetical protein
LPDTWVCGAPSSLVSLTSGLIKLVSELIPKLFKWKNTQIFGKTYFISKVKTICGPLILCVVGLPPKYPTKPVLSLLQPKPYYADADSTRILQIYVSTYRDKNKQH